MCIPGGSANLPVPLGTLPGQDSQLLEAAVRALAWATVKDGVASSSVAGGGCLGWASDDGGLCHETNRSGQQNKGVSVAGRKEQLKHVLSWELGRRSGGCSARRRLSASRPRGPVGTAGPL